MLGAQARTARKSDVAGLLLGQRLPEEAAAGRRSRSRTSEVWPISASNFECPSLLVAAFQCRSLPVGPSRCRSGSADRGEQSLGRALARPRADRQPIAPSLLRLFPCPTRLSFPGPPVRLGTAIPSSCRLQPAQDDDPRASATPTHPLAANQPAMSIHQSLQSGLARTASMDKPIESRTRKLSATQAPPPQQLLLMSQAPASTETALSLLATQREKKSQQKLSITNNYFLPIKQLIRQGNLAQLKKLYSEKKFPLQMPDPQNGWPGLFYAAAYGQNDILKFYLDAGHEAEKTAVDLRGNTAPMVAVEHGNEQGFAMYFERFPKVLDICNLNEETLLILAVRRGLTKAVNTLLDAGAEINKPDKAGNTPLHHALAFGHFDLIALLIERGADPKIKNKLEWVPLEYAYSFEVADYMQECLCAHSEHRSLRRKDTNTTHSSLGQGSAQPDAVRMLFDRGV
ncbi:ankyrin repeat-containing domain protein [Polychytrium aggregatum]|uniref:ankyrin repeat-containing domain protein n=1 Tax=Polychytrium aggregatum TaxID=110093 RepID=UPI0022FEDD68|nr:ankyrin repeat-containing domain protein [Polychytrium aggregatum]KAI9208165.1 ankyrin repeat-containing domain protein [Polychytrium aggregatum]